MSQQCSALYEVHCQLIIQDLDEPGKWHVPVIQIGAPHGLKFTTNVLSLNDLDSQGSCDGGCIWPTGEGRLRAFACA